MRLRRLTAAAACAALVVPLFGATTAQAAPAVPDGLRLITTHESVLATHYWYTQTLNGHTVLGGFYARHVSKTTGAETIDDGRVSVSGFAASAAPQIAASQAAGVAPGSVRRNELAVSRDGKLVYSVVSDAGHGSVRTLVDATTGSVLSSESLIKNVDGTGRVFSPNPVATLQNENLVDDNDRNSAVPDAAYRSVRLTNLDGSGFLHGSFATIIDPRGQQARSRTNDFNYNRANDFFEQVMSYYSITEAEKYIQSLGFNDVNNEPQDVTTTGFKDDNSFYDPEVDGITFGTGGVDDAEDAEVIWHEYGHAIQDAQVPGFGTTIEAGSIGEGFGDWWAMIMSAPVQRDTATTPLACIADWDSVSYTDTTPHCLRRTDENLTVADFNGEVHHDGQVWSRALFDIFRALGRNNSAKLILESQFSYRPDTTMAAAANVTVSTARTLFGSRDARAVSAAFHARGII
jgi:Zn-dependent metalloprotease